MRKRERAQQRRADRAREFEVARLGAARGRLAVTAWQLSIVQAASFPNNAHPASDQNIERSSK